MASKVENHDLREEITRPELADLSLEDTKQLTTLAMSLVDEGVRRGDYEADPESKSAYLLFVVAGIAFRLGEARQRTKDDTQPVIKFNDFNTIGS